ncbi:MAG: hypothetical protein OFPII_00800 [Osedax symbiont Rs1]|nr:MAG: hypothetical protein OFPII_00800 [Osedax symbiont Rs1]
MPTGNSEQSNKNIKWQSFSAQRLCDFCGGKILLNLNIIEAFGSIHAIELLSIVHWVTIQ